MTNPSDFEANLAVAKEMIQGGSFAPVLCSAGCCVECHSCAAKSGSPGLCQDCRRRRDACNAKHKQERVLLVRPEWLESARKLMAATEPSRDEDRCKILWINYKELRELLLSPSCISNLPADARIEDVCHDFERRAFGMRIWSSEFPIAPPGGHLPAFGAEITDLGIYAGIVAVSADTVSARIAEALEKAGSAPADVIADIQRKLSVPLPIRTDEYLAMFGLGPAQPCSCGGTEDKHKYPCPHWEAT